MSEFLKAVRNIRASFFIFRIINWAHLRRSGPSAIAPLIAVACGVALLEGVLILNCSLISSYEAELSELYGFAQIEIIANDINTNTEQLITKIRSVPGVAEAAPVLEGQALFEGITGRAQVLVLGGDFRLWKLIHHKLDQSKLQIAFSTADKMAVSTLQLLSEVGAKPGDRVSLHSGTRKQSFTITSTLHQDLGARINGGRIVVIPLSTAQTLLGRTGMVSSILVRASEVEPSKLAGLIQRLENVLGKSVQVLPLSTRLADLEQSTRPARAFSNFVSLVVLFVSGFLTYNLFSMAIFRRNKELAILIAIGEEPKRLKKHIAAEAFCVGSVGSLIGIIIGILIGKILVENSPSFLESAYTFKTRIFYPFWTFGASILCGLGAAILGGRIPARAVERLFPADVLKDQVIHYNKAIKYKKHSLPLYSSLLAAAGLIFGIFFPLFAIPAFSVALLGLVLGSPAILGNTLDRATNLLLRYPFSFGSAIVQIAAAGIRQNRARMVAAGCGAAFSLAMVVSIGATADRIEESVRRFAKTFRFFDFYGTATEDPYMRIPLEVENIDSLLKIHGIQQVQVTFSQFIRWEGRRVLLFGESDDLQGSLRFTVKSGDFEKAVQDLKENGILVSTHIAQLKHLVPGDEILLVTPCGLQTFRVGAILETWSWQQGTMVIGDDWFRKCFGRDQPNQLKFALKPASDRSQVLQELREIMPRMVFVSGDDLAQEISDHLKGHLQPFRLVQLIAIIMVFFLTINTNLMAVSQARREYAILRAIGVFRLEISKAVLLSTAFVLCLAIPYGVILSVLMQLLGLKFITATSGLPLQWAFSAGSLIMGALAITSAALIGTVYPAWFGWKIDVMDTLRNE